MIEFASTNSQAVYLANSGNWNSVRNSLLYYGSTTNTLNSLINAGYTLLLPQNGSNRVAGAGTWAGDGYVQLGVTANGRQMGMIISGGYNGGYDSTRPPPLVALRLSFRKLTTRNRHFSIANPPLFRSQARPGPIR